MKNIASLLVSLVILLPFTSYAQFYERKEPANNIGKSLDIMKKLFPDLRYIKTDQKGAKYEDGYTQDGISMFFYFINNQVVEESMTIQSDNEFPEIWFDNMLETLIKNYTPGFGTGNAHDRHWCFSTFLLHLKYTSKNGINTATITYEKGGYETGITGKEFFKKYDPK